MTTKHPSWEELVAHVFDGAPMSDPVHLDACHDCRSAIIWLDRLARGLELAAIPEPSAGLVDLAWARMQADRHEALADKAKNLVARAHAGLRDVFAVLTRDSLSPNLAVRGSSLATPRVLVFESDDFAVSISLEHAPSRVDVLGQVAPKGPSTARLVGTAVATAGGRTVSTEISEFGEFGFPGLPSGPLTLTIRIGDTQLHLAPIPTGEDA